MPPTYTVVGLPMLPRFGQPSSHQPSSSSGPGLQRLGLCLPKRLHPGGLTRLPNSRPAALHSLLLFSQGPFPGPVCHGQGLGSPVGGDSDLKEHVRCCLLPPETHTHLEPGPPPVSGEIGLCLLLGPSVRACVKDLGVILASEPPQWPLVPIGAKDAVPGDVTPAGNEVAPPPGQPGLGFQKTECLTAVLTGQDSGRAGKLSQARLGIGEQLGGPGSWFSLVRSWKERGGRSV